MDNISPELLQQIMELGGLSEEQALLKLQLAQADQLRNTEIPKGGMAGRVYVADPLGALAAGVDRYKGQKQYTQGLRDYKGTIGKQNAGRSAYYNLLRGTQLDPAGEQGNGVTTYGIP